jgi:hypothetical protein
VILPEFFGDLVSRVHHETQVGTGFVAVVRRAELINGFNRGFGQASRTIDIQRKCAASGKMPRYPAARDDGCQRSNGVGAPAESDEKDAVSVAVKTDQGGIAVDDIGSYSESGRFAREVV